MAEKETPNERRLREEKELDKMSRSAIRQRYEDRGPIGKLVDKALGVGDGFGTSRSAGARYVGDAEAEKIYQTEGKTVGEVMRDTRPRQKMREAAAEERREASRGMKKGGVVSASKRGDGIAQRGKTRGRMR